MLTERKFSARWSDVDSFQTMDRGDTGGSGGDKIFTICLAPDRFHLRHVGQTRQGNGYWVTSQLASEAGGTRDFIVGYLFDQNGEMIAADVVDLGLRKGGYDIRARLRDRLKPC